MFCPCLSIFVCNQNHFVVQKYQTFSDCFQAMLQMGSGVHMVASVSVVLHASLHQTAFHGVCFEILFWPVIVYMLINCMARVPNL